MSFLYLTEAGYAIDQNTLHIAFVGACAEHQQAAKRIGVSPSKPRESTHALSPRSILACLHACMVEGDGFSDMVSI